MSFWAYLKKKIQLPLYYLLSTGIFYLCLRLYGLPVHGLIYPLVLVLIPALGFLLWDYRRWRQDIIRQAALEDELLNLQRQLINQQRQSQEQMDYFGMWAHQIKTPIAAMGLSLQGQDTSESRRLRNDLGRIEHYADMVMAYLRLSPGSTDYLFREQELDDIIRAAVRKFSGEFIARKIALDYAPVERRVLTDEKWLGFVLEQLISNALKYTPAGSISIYMDGDSLCIADTGIGIAPEDIPRIFDRGFTGCNGREDKRASGIGLYLCKKICSRLGHGISVDSAPGAGTGVRLDLSHSSLDLRE